MLIVSASQVQHLMLYDDSGVKAIVFLDYAIRKNVICVQIFANKITPNI